MRDMLEYTFVIPGACPPKGSRVPVRPGSDKTRESSKRVEPWTEGAKKAMRDHLGNPLVSFSGPVYVVPTFVMRRPKVTEFEFPTAITIGDLDKLVRCLLDAMTKAGVIEDDRFVVDLGDDNGGRPRKIWGGIERTIVRVGRMPSPRPSDCASRLPGGDWQDCSCENPAACGEASAGAETQRAVNPYEVQWRPEEYCTTASCNGGSPHYHEGNGSWICVCMRNGCEGGCPPPSNIPPPPIENSVITSDVGGWVQGIQGPTDYGVCPLCGRAPLMPGDNGSGVKCSSESCRYWFCY